MWLCRGFSIFSLEWLVCLVNSVVPLWIVEKVGTDNQLNNLPSPWKAVGGNQCCYNNHEDKVGMSVQDNPHLSLHKIRSAATKMANMMNQVKLHFFALVLRSLDSAIHLKIAIQ